jgi:hypothetical protein
MPPASFERVSLRAAAGPSRRRERSTLAFVWVLTLAIGLCIASMLGASRVAADDASIVAAEAAYGRGALREANRLFLAALREPGHERAELVRIHVHLGILAGATGAERTARNHFAIALAVDPSLAVPSELAGRDRSRFEQERPARALALSVEPSADESGAALVIRASNAPVHLVARIEVRCGSQVLAPSPLSRTDPSNVRVSLGSAACAEGVSITALDGHGGILVRARRGVNGQEAP